MLSLNKVLLTLSQTQEQLLKILRSDFICFVISFQINSVNVKSQI